MVPTDFDDDRPTHPRVRPSPEPGPGPGPGPDDGRGDEAEGDDPTDEAESLEVAREFEEQRRLWLSTLGSLSALAPPPEDADGAVYAEYGLTMRSIYDAIRRVLRGNLPGER